LGRAERETLYEIPEVQALLKMFADRALSELLPEFHPKFGVRYPGMEEVTGDTQKAKDLLQQLVQAEILRPKFYEKITVCPHCGTKNVIFRYYCAYCGSHEIEKRKLYEHLKCGAIDGDDRFLKSGKLTCPRCLKPVAKLGLDYRQVGTWFQCRSCGKRFDTPNGRHYCRECGSKFGIKESVLEDIHSYVLDKNAQTEFAREILFLAPLKKIMRDVGYSVEAPSVVKGVSGTSHNFDMVGSKTEGSKRTIVTIDMAICDGVCGEEYVVSAFAKAFDVSPSKSILIAIPALSDKAKKLANQYRLEVIEGEKPEKISRGFVETLGKVLMTPT